MPPSLIPVRATTVRHRAWPGVVLAFALSLPLAVNAGQDSGAPGAKAGAIASALNSQDQQTRPRIGLVLSGGGARGGAHIGVLRVLQQMNVPVDVIVGTSAGAIIGAAYASGMSMADIEAEIKPLHTALLFRDTARSDLPVRLKADEENNYIGPEIGINAHGLALPKGAVAGVSLEAVLRRLTAHQRSQSFDQLPIPFRAVATDLTTAEMVVLDQGSLASAVRASMALPALVNPVELDGRLLVDGGVSRNLPIDVARAMGADVIIAVNIGTPLQQRAELTSLLSVSEQMVRILTAKNVSHSLKELGPKDILIMPEMGNIGTGDFDRLFEASGAGETAARAVAAQLERYRIDPAAFAAREQQRIVPPAGAVRVDEVRITGVERVNSETVRAAIHTHPGDVFNAQATDTDIKRLYGTGDFERVSYYLNEGNDGKRVLTADVAEKSWGPHFLRFGLGLSSDFEGNSYFNFLVTHRRRSLNSLGAEWRNDLQIGLTDRLRTEWYQPLDASQRFFAAAKAEATREPFDLYYQGQRFSRYRRVDAKAGLDVGVTLGQIGELRAGYVKGRVRLSTDTGVVPGKQLVPSTEVDGVTARLRIDTLDSLRFPRSGYALDLGYFRARPVPDAPGGYRKLDLTLRGAASAGAHSLRAMLLGTHAIGGDDLPNYELTQLGGFLRLSGYRSGEIIGTEARMGRLVYTYRIAAPGLLDGVHVGASAEMGRIIDALGSSDKRATLRSNALFIAADTLLGPVYLAYGRAPGGRSTTYLYLGLP